MRTEVDFHGQGIGPVVVESNPYATGINIKFPAGMFPAICDGDAWMWCIHSLAMDDFAKAVSDAAKAARMETVK